MKVIFFFAGTACTKDEYATERDNFLDYPDDVVRIYVNGCQDPCVGGAGGMLAPDLEIAAKNVDCAFTHQGSDCTLDTAKLQKAFAGRLIIRPSEPTVIKDIESIALEGYSRGAVTTLAVAKKLNRLNIPLHVIANQPVTGEKKNLTLFNRYQDLAGLNNIKMLTTFYAMHEKRGLGVVYDHYFKTMIPSNAENKRADILLPQQKHKRSTTNESGGPTVDKALVSTPAPYHIAALLKSYGYAKIKDKAYDTMKALIPHDPGEAANKEQLCIKSWYASQNYYFTPSQFAQEIYHSATGDRTRLSESSEYLALQRDKANAVLIDLHKPPLDETEDNKAQKAIAIMAVHHAFEQDGNPKEKERIIDAILKDSCRLSLSIKEIASSCAHLSQRTYIKNTTKSERITKHSKPYQRTVFSACVDSLADNNPDKLKQALSNATEQFISDAQLSKDRRTSSSLLRTLLKRIISLMCFNKNASSQEEQSADALKQYKTGFFEVKSVKIIDEIKKEIIKNHSGPGK